MTRAEVINKIISYRPWYGSYLEIGVDDPDNTFNKVSGVYKVGVDPYLDNTTCHQWDDGNKEVLVAAIETGKHVEFHRKTSDEFFETCKGKLDIIFIDGLHLEEQVDKDIQNAVEFVSDGGIILVDDVCPANWNEALEQPEPRSAWRGTVYRSFWKIRRQKMLETGVIHEAGLGFIMKRPASTGIPPGSWPKVQGMTNKQSFEFYQKHRPRLMGEIFWDQFLLKYL